MLYEEAEHLEVADRVVSEAAIPELTRAHSDRNGVRAKVLKHRHHTVEVVMVRMGQADELEYIVSGVRIGRGFPLEAIPKEGLQIVQGLYQRQQAL